MSETENRSTPVEEEILEAEVLSEEPSTPATASINPLLRTVLIALAGFTLLGGIFWGILQQHTEQSQQQSAQQSQLMQQQVQQLSAQQQQNQQQIGGLSSQVQQMSGALEAQQNTTTKFGHQLTQQLQLFNELQTQIQSSVQQQEHTVQELLHNNRKQSLRLNESVAALSRRIDRRESNLHTSAALRLLQIAEEQLLIVQDLQTTQQALAQAGQQLIASGDPILLPIHEIVQQELKRVRETETPDLQAAVSQLRGAIEQGMSLPFDQPAEYIPTAEAPTTEVPIEWNWESISQKIWRDLLTLVRIDKEENELPVIASRSEEQLSHLILRLRLEQAQSTLLMRNTALFHERIDYAQEWLKVFDSESAAVQNLQQQLEALKQLQLQPTRPTIGEAHRRLREIVAERSSQKLTAELAPEEAK